MQDDNWFLEYMSLGVGFVKTEKYKDIISTKIFGGWFLAEKEMREWRMLIDHYL